MRFAKARAVPLGRSAALITLALMPSVAFHALGGATAEGVTMVGLLSYGFHAVLLAFLPLRREGDLLQSFALSMLSLSLLLAGSYFLREGGGRGLMPAAENLLSLSLAWLAGAVLVGALNMLLRGTANAPGPEANWVARLTSLVLAGVLLTTAIWLARGGAALMLGAIPDWAGLITAFLLAALATVIATSGQRAQELQRRARGRAQRLVALLGFAMALTLASVAQAVPDVGFLGTGGAGLLFGLTAALTLALIGGELADFGATLLLMAMIVLGLPALTAAMPVLQLTAGVLLAALLGASFLPLRDRSGRGTQLANQPTALVMSTLQSRLGSFVLRLDFEEKGVHFPFGGGEQFGADPDLTLNEFFRLAPMRAVLDLMQRLQRGESPTGLPVRFRLRRAAPAEGGGEGRQDWTGQSFILHVLENRYPNCWIVLERQSETADQLEAQAQTFDRLLSAAVLREERLLMLVAQDLAAPAAALRDLSQAVTEGREVAELLPALTLTMKVLADTMEDMRAGAGMADGMVAHGGFTLQQIAAQMETAFRAQARREGAALLISLPQQGQLLLRGDHGRVQVALARLIDNALRHATATEIRLSAFLTEGQGGEVTVSWHVTDNGRGIDARRRAELFEPLSAGALRPGARPTLGLFAARKAIRMIGGEISLQPDGNGTHLVLTHPARIAPKDALPEAAVFEGEPDADLLGRRILYYAPEESADLPLAALLRIVGRVDRSTTLADAIVRVVQSSPDLVVLAPELEPATRSEAVKALLQTSAELPLLIAVPAGTSASAQVLSGSRVRVMEAPVSQLSLRRLAKELIAPAEASAA